jgi:hypothetical protein
VTAGLGLLSKVYPDAASLKRTAFAWCQVERFMGLFGFRDHAFAYVLAVYIVEDLFNIPEALDLGYGV